MNRKRPKCIKIILSGDPVSTNNLYQTRKPYGKGSDRYMTEKGKRAKANYELELMQQYDGPVLTCPVFVGIKLFFGDRRRRDRDNRHKISMDSLQGHVLVNDDQIVKAYVEKCYDKGNPRIEIDIFPQYDLDPTTDENLAKTVDLLSK